MPIQKFKTFEEAERALWNFKPDAEYYRQVAALYKLYSKLSTFSYPKGVFKFKTFEEAEKHKMDAIVESAKKNKLLLKKNIAVPNSISSEKKT